jgi:Rieske Fe-S protein
MSAAPHISRRAALAALTTGTAGFGLALVGCSGGASGGGAPPSAKPGQKLAELSAIPVGQAISADLDGRPVIVARPTSTTAACFSAVCTHLGCTVTPQGDQLFCPCHGSLFAATTGKVLRGPAPTPLPRIAVRVSNGAVVTAGST